MKLSLARRKATGNPLEGMLPQRRKLQHRNRKQTSVNFRFMVAIVFRNAVGTRIIRFQS